jgi:hypothetical protein
MPGEPTTSTRHRVTPARRTSHSQTATSPKIAAAVARSLGAVSPNPGTHSFRAEASTRPVTVPIATVIAESTV